MNKVIFETKDREYYIVFEKTKKFMSFNNSSQRFNNYICSISVEDKMHSTILKYICNEYDFLKMISSFYEFGVNLGNIMSDVVYTGLDENMISGFIYFSLIYSTERGDEYALDDIDDNVYISFQFFESSQQGNRLRLYFKLDIEKFDELVYSMYTLIDDIEYLYDMTSAELLDFMQYKYYNL